MIGAVSVLAWVMISGLVVTAPIILLERDEQSVVTVQNPAVTSPARIASIT
jgi:hypothetical protein